MRVLAVGAHPDDLEFLCAGTLAKFKEKEAKIFMSYLCDGSMGHFEILGPELAKIRKKEPESPAKFPKYALGKSHFCGVRLLTFF